MNYRVCADASREVHVLLQPGSNSTGGVWYYRRKSRELIVERVPKGSTRNFMRDVASTCANIHVYDRRAGVHVQACEQYEGPSGDVKACTVENAAIYIKPYCPAGIIGVKCFILHRYKLMYHYHCLYAHERLPWVFIRWTWQIFALHLVKQFKSEMNERRKDDINLNELVIRC